MLCVCPKKDSGDIRVLHEWEEREEKIRAGILSAQDTRTADNANTPIVKHVDDYVAHLQARDCADKHVRERRRCLDRVLKDCGFHRVRDLEGDTFGRWLTARAQEGMGARTRNVYRSAVNAFAAWLLTARRIAAHPFEHIKAANEQTDKRRNRRALSDAELTALLEAARVRPFENALRASGNLRPETKARLLVQGEMRALFYRLLVETGLRYSEAKALHASQLVLDAATPHLVLRPGDTKNRQGGKIALHGELAAALALHIDRLVGLLHLNQHGAISNVLKFGAVDEDPLLFDLPSNLVRIFDKDLAAAGIAKHDAQGRVVDLHSLRATFATRHARAGTPPQVLQRLMRHSNPALTMRHYVHLDLGDMGAAVSALPSLTTPKNPLQNVAQNVALTKGFPCQNPAISGNTGIAMQDGERLHSYEQKSPDTLGNRTIPEEIAGKKEWRPQRDLNPCRQRERLVS